MNDLKLHLVLRLELRELRGEDGGVVGFRKMTWVGSGADDDASSRSSLSKCSEAGWSWRLRPKYWRNEQREERRGSHG
jgi:hypothetical protein